jgi:hypothetical protein
MKTIEGLLSVNLRRENNHLTISMMVKFAAIIVLVLGLVATSPAVEADGYESLEGKSTGLIDRPHYNKLLVSENGECDWIDRGCRNWDSISCTCHDSSYAFESCLRDNTPNQVINNANNGKSGGSEYGGHCPSNHRCQDRWNPHTCKCEGKWCGNHDPHCKDWNWGHCKCNSQGGQCPHDHHCQDRWNPHTCKCEGKWCGNHDPHCKDWNWGHCKCNSHGGQCPHDHHCQDRWNPHTCKCEGKWCGNHDPRCNNWNWKTCSCSHRELV